jgi:hypothetical protein
MTALTALLLLAATASAGVAAPWLLLAVPIYALVQSRGSARTAAVDESAMTAAPAIDEEVVATIYERAGRLVLRRMPERGTA